MKGHPHLPVKLIKSLKLIEGAGESTSYNPTFHVVRLDIQNPFDTDFDANTLLDIPRAKSFGLPGYRCTYLHDAAHSGDVILACEMIRLGANVNAVDTQGNTPLIIGTMRLANLQRTNRPSTPVQNPLYSRISIIVRTLIEHLADVNFISGGQTALHHACEAQDWEIVALLINYGANPSLRGADPLIPSLKAADAQRLQNLHFQHGRRKDNGPHKRPCPCFSGLLLEECHARREQPYPEHHACPGPYCQGLKPYGECCLPRRIQVLEVWDEEAQRIKTFVTSTIYPDPEEEVEDHPMHEVREKLTAYFSGGLNVEGDVVDIMRFFACDSKVCPDGVDERACDAYKKLALYRSRALTEGLVDPAFGYALKRASFVPWPVGRQRTKAFCKERQERWNALVDRYIDKKGDSRPRVEIERAAKLGNYLGAQIASCYSSDCHRSCLRDQEGQALMRCGRCKMSTYCSRECQESDWARHKHICGKRGQRPQALPSQILLDQYCWNTLLQDLRDSQTDTPTSNPTGG